VSDQSLESNIFSFSKDRKIFLFNCLFWLYRKFKVCVNYIDKNPKHLVHWKTNCNLVKVSEFVFPKTTMTSKSLRFENWSQYYILTIKYSDLPELRRLGTSVRRQRDWKLPQVSEARPSQLKSGHGCDEKLLKDKFYGVPRIAKIFSGDHHSCLMSANVWRQPWIWTPFVSDLSPISNSRIKPTVLFQVKIVWL